MSSHANISVFVPHIGCPNRCSFCDQIHITGTATVPTAEDVKNAVRTAIGKKGYNSANTELAFFGGSFTAIDTDYRRQLLLNLLKKVTFAASEFRQDPTRSTKKF